MTRNFVWLTSFPRSGNTLLRTILNHCFGLKPTSVYPNDLGGNKALEEYIGHVEHKREADGRLRFPADKLSIVKTHALPPDQSGALYVVRDGRAACVSLWEFQARKYSLESIILGQNTFGTWSAHIDAWAPWERPDCLLVKYEDMVNALPSVIPKLSQYFDLKPVATQIPDRTSIVQVDGTWVRSKSDWRNLMNDNQLKLFHDVNGLAMSKMAYNE